MNKDTKAVIVEGVIIVALIIVVILFGAWLGSR